MCSVSMTAAETGAATGVFRGAPLTRAPNLLVGRFPLRRSLPDYWPSFLATRLATFTPLRPLTYFAMPR
jgi:hypothetical protein